MIESKAVKILKEVKEVLDELDIEFFLESGVLLGAIREGRFIKWDQDIDLGTWDRYIPKMKIISKAFSDREFETYYSIYNNSIGLWKNGISVDFNFWRLGNKRAIVPLRYSYNFLGKIIYYADWIILFSHYGKVSSEPNNIKYRVARYFAVKITDLLPEVLKLIIARLLRSIAIKSGNLRGLVVIPSHFYLNLKKLEFHGMNFNIPERVEDYLIYYFGDDWKTPKKDWNYENNESVIISRTERIGENWKYYKKQYIENPQ